MHIEPKNEQKKKMASQPAITNHLNQIIGAPSLISSHLLFVDFYFRSGHEVSLDCFIAILNKLLFIHHYVKKIDTLKLI